jgi:uncharacterized protein RhaS with RHS repeats
MTLRPGSTRWEHYYDPAVGRFTQTDPLGGGYRYVQNNPVDLIDPSGYGGFTDLFTGLYSLYKKYKEAKELWEAGKQAYEAFKKSEAACLWLGCGPAKQGGEDPITGASMGAGGQGGVSGAGGQGGVGGAGGAEGGPDAGPIDSNGGAIPIPPRVPICPPDCEAGL